MPTLDDVHQGVGSGELTCGYDRELIGEALDYRHILVRRNGRVFGTFVILSRTPSRDGITLAGYGLGWWNGDQAAGPMIRRREYIAGNNQVSNGDFELLDALDFPLLWSRSEGSSWAPYTADKHSGARSMRINGDLGKDDVLVHTDARPVSPGALVRAQAYASIISAGIRHYRLRTLYTGRFDHPNLLPALATWDNGSDVEDDLAVAGHTVTGGPVTRPQIVNNPGFEAGLTGWIKDPDPDPAWGIDLDAYEGSQALSHIDITGSTGTLKNDIDTSSPTVVNAWPVKKGERYQAETVCKATTGTDGFYDVRIFPNFGAPVSVAEGTGESLAGQGYKYSQKEIEIQDEGSGLLVSINVWQQTAGKYLFDRCSITRVKGNTAVLSTPDEITLVPEKAYKFLVPVQASAECTGGDIRWAIAIGGTGRDDQQLVSGTVDYQQKSRTLLEFSFTPPSGYDTLKKASLVWTDVVGASIDVLGEPSLEMEDTSVSIVDKIIGPSGSATWAQFIQDSVAPDGVEKVEIEVVAEAGSGSAAFDDVDWHRREATTSVPVIIDDLLRDPDTGEYVVGAGGIFPTGVPAWDWLIVNETNGAAMREFLGGGRISPAVEWRHDPDNTFHVGTAAQLFEDTGLLFVDEDLLLLSRGEIQLMAEDRLTRVVAIGAALQRPAPLPDAVIVGEASASIPDAYDWFGNPVSRTRIIEDSALNFQAFAEARAVDELDRSATTTQNVTVEIADPSAWGSFPRCGDWVDVDKEHALLRDMDNPKTYKGRRVYPVKTRVMGRRLTGLAVGDGWTFSIRRPDGTEWPIPPSLIRDTGPTKATLELGDRRIDYDNDPQGPAAGLQFLAWRKRQAVTR